MNKYYNSIYTTLNSAETVEREQTRTWRSIGRLVLILVLVLLQGAQKLLDLIREIRLFDQVLWRLVRSLSTLKTKGDA